jgi:photosynthetic reaction center cytochrome c subunit
VTKVKSEISPHSDKNLTLVPTDLLIDSHVDLHAFRKPWTGTVSRDLRTARRGDNIRLGSKRRILGATGMAFVCLVGVALVSGQAAPAGQAVPSGQARPAGQTTPAAKPPMSEELFKNIQVLKGIPVDQFMGTMGFIAASLSVNCTECHISSDYSADTEKKKKAREMMLMVKAINQEHFGGARRITCYTCHRSDTAPRVTPSLAEQYGTPPDRDPNDIEIAGQPDPGALTADQILDKYIQALGGAERLAGLASLSAKGTYAGFDTDLEKVPAEVYAKAPGQSTTIVHRSASAQNITTYDGRNGWIAMTNTRLPLKSLTGGELDGAQLDAEMFFPSGIKHYLSNWRVGFPPTSIDDHEVQVVQGTAPGGTRVKLFFDPKSGLLLRMARFANTALGLNPSQVDYSDYREVAGVKVPFHWTLSWTDGRSDFDMTDVQPNLPIDAAKFAEPALPKPAKP